MNDIQKAVDLLRSGEVVAIPTETVYGLAASIESEHGLKKIFALKERPFFDPLIVHVGSVEMAKGLALEWTQACEVLAQAFWPGPLTLVVPKNDKVSDLITSGLDSVGLRNPSHPVALEAIRLLGVPLAAPSANKFKRTSPVAKEHVEDEFGSDVFALEGGESRVGIESTVAAVFPDKIEIYRPGAVSRGDMLKALAGAGLKLPVHFASSPVAPGQLKHHYMPNIPVALSWDQKDPNLSGTVLQNKTLSKWEVEDNPEQTARKLYAFFREAEKSGKEGVLLCLKSSWKTQDKWAGVLNRLDKAKSLELFAK